MFLFLPFSPHLLSLPPPSLSLPTYSPPPHLSLSPPSLSLSVTLCPPSVIYLIVNKLLSLSLSLSLSATVSSFMPPRHSSARTAGAPPTVRTADRERACKDCGGHSICEHNRQKSRCKDCGGAFICEHNRERSTCKDCGCRSSASTTE